MKYILLVSLCCLPGSLLYAQPVINNASAPGEGDSFVIYSADTVDFGPGEAGGDVTWDLSSVNTDTVIGFSFEYVNPIGLSFSDSFPDANLALVVTSNGSIANTFFKLNDSGIELLGNSLGNFSITTYSDTRQQVVFPFTYQSSFTDEFASVSNSSGIMSTTEGVDSVFVDGYGTLILPDRLGTRSLERFENVLRVRVITNQTTTTSIGGINSETDLWLESYTWVSPDYTTSLATHQFSSGETRTYVIPGNPIVSPLPEVTSFSWTEQDATTPVFSRIAEESLRVKWLSSQPVRDEIHLSVSSPQARLLRWEMFNAGGGLVTSGKMPLSLEENSLIIPSRHSPGLYLIRFHTDRGLQETVKFIKQ